MLPHGTRIYNALLNMLKREYKRYQYDEIMTNIYKMPVEYERASTNYREDMHGNQAKAEASASTIESDREWASNMNCPGHCLVYKHQPRSYRSLPLRVADFSPYRNEISALSGPTRPCKFSKMMPILHTDQVKKKKRAQAVLGYGPSTNVWFDHRMRLSTRPKKYIGNSDLWDKAEDTLEALLDEQDNNGLIIMAMEVGINIFTCIRISRRCRKGLEIYDDRYNSEESNILYVFVGFKTFARQSEL